MRLLTLALFALACTELPEGKDHPTTDTGDTDGEDSITPCGSLPETMNFGVDGPVDPGAEPLTTATATWAVSNPDAATSRVSFFIDTTTDSPLPIEPVLGHVIFAHAMAVRGDESWSISEIGGSDSDGESTGDRFLGQVSGWGDCDADKLELGVSWVAVYGTPPSDLVFQWHTTQVATTEKGGETAWRAGTLQAYRGVAQADASPITFAGPAGESTFDYVEWVLGRL